jgi:pimeloyl-ACP methyl ester carboxylesterase
LHGFTGNYETYWARVTETLRPHFQVIGVDARGHGKSGKPDDPDAYGVQMVKDVANLMDHLGIEKAHVAGYSMGGYVALKMASIYPDRLLSAVSGGQGMVNNEDLGRFVPRYHAGLQRWIDEQVPFGPWGELDNDPKALQHALNSFQLMTISPGDASALHVPVLAIHGSLDDRSGSTNRLKAAQPNVEVIVIDGEDHLSTFNAEAFSSALLNWFRSLQEG